MSARELRFGIFGTFDVQNYGDLLFPLIAEAELSQRLGPLTLQKFSYHDKAPPQWPYTVTSLSRLADEAVSLDGVIIGGGHVIRFDKAIAPDYYPPSPAIHHPTGYWLTPALVGLNGDLPVVWNAPGVHGKIPAWARPLMKLAMSGSSYVSVRDEPSRRALEGIAVNTEISVVPDTAFGVGRLVKLESPSAELLRVRGGLGLTGAYIVVQATSALRPFARFLRQNAEAFAGYKLLALPVCPIHGDDNTALDEDLPGLERLPFWPAPLLLAELIGHASAVIGVSLHLSISALAFGVPLFRPANAFGGKYAILSKFDGVFRLDEAGGVDPAKLGAALGRSGPSPAVSAALRLLVEHWDTAAVALVTRGKRASNLRATNGFWSRAAGLLEVTPLPGVGLMRQLAAREERVVAFCRSASRKLTTPLRSLAAFATEGSRRSAKGGNSQ